MNIDHLQSMRRRPLFYLEEVVGPQWIHIAVMMFLSYGSDYINDIKDDGVYC